MAVVVRPVFIHVVVIAGGDEVFVGVAAEGAGNALIIVSLTHHGALLRTPMKLRVLPVGLVKLIGRVLPVELACELRLFESVC